jgi:hypothetical protein
MGLQDEIVDRAKANAIGGLGDIMGSPLARAAVKYWWVAVPIGYCAWRSWQMRKAKGSVNAMDVVLDTAPVVSLIATLVLLNSALKSTAPTPVAATVRAPAKPAPAAAPRASDGPVIRDADFTPRPREAANDS